MKRTTIIGLALTVLILATVAWAADATANSVTATVGPQAPTAWFWGPVVNTREVFLGDYDDRTVVVEGQIGERVDPQAWNIYLFTGSDDTSGDYVLRINLPDAMPTADVPRTATVRIIGEPNNAEIDVFGLELMGETAVTASAAVNQINAGEFDDENVVVEGQIGELVDDLFNIYRFSDATGTVDANFQDELASSQLPFGRSSIIYAQVKSNNGARELDADMILLASSNGGQETPTPTTAKLTYFPYIAKVADGASPTSTPVPTVTAEPPTAWVWNTSHTVTQINGGCCDQQVVVVEGVVGAKDNTNPDWNEYNFSDDSGSIMLDFEDQIPAAAIPQDGTVRVIGKAENNNYRKIDVYGIQTLGNVSAQPNRTVAEISGGCCEGQDVAVKGTLGALDENYPGWNIYDFSDGGATIKANLEDDLAGGQAPLDRAILIFGEVSDLFGEPELDADLMLIADNIN